MKKQLKAWLEDPKRTMKQGIEIFEAVAPKDLRAKYLPYFQDNKSAKAHSTPYGMLINKLTFIERNNLIAEPVKQAVQEPIAQKPVKEITDRPLSTLDGIAEELIPTANRIKEIVPMIAALTAKIAEPNLPVEEAKEASEEIVALETERRELWDVIDKALTLPGSPEVQEEAELVLPTTAAAKKKAIKNLKEKVKRNMQAAEEATDEEKKQRSLGLVEKYTKELALVEATKVAE